MNAEERTDRASRAEYGNSPTHGSLKDSIRSMKSIKKEWN